MQIKIHYKQQEVIITHIHLATHKKLLINFKKEINK